MAGFVNYSITDPDKNPKPIPKWRRWLPGIGLLALLGLVAALLAR
jgi:hypothetical protein